MVLENITALIQELPNVLEAVADMIPSVVKIIIFLAIASFVVGLFAAIISKIKKGVKV